MSRAVLLAGFGLIACADTGPPGPGCGDVARTPECRTLRVGDATREFLLHVPRNFPPSGGSLVIALHGLGDDAAGMRERTRLDGTADAAGFAVAYPGALPPPGATLPSWQIYVGETSLRETADVQFLRAMITTLRAELALAPERVFVVGFSNGGFMAHRVGVELGDLVAAIAVVSGALASLESSPVPNAGRPVPVLMIHGDQDGNIPPCPFKRPASQDLTFDYWAGPSGNACRTVTPDERICVEVDVPSALFAKRAFDCADGTEVVFYRLEGGRHVWYTAPLNVAGMEPFNPLLDATTGTTLNDVVWSFFASRPPR